MGRKDRGYSADVSNGIVFSSMVYGLATDIDTRYTKTAMTEAAAHMLETAFWNHLDAHANHHQERFHHIYEWGMIGLPEGRLVQTTVVNRSGQTEIDTAFEQSQTTVPAYEYTLEDGTQYSQTPEQHVFKLKAEIMEFGIPVTVKPQPGKKLMFENSDGHLIFTNKEVNISNPGGTATKGAFQTEWEMYWQTRAQKVLQDAFYPERDKLFSMSMQQELNKLSGDRSGARSRNQSLTFAPGKVSVSSARNKGKSAAAKVNQDFVNRLRKIQRRAS